LLCGLGAFLALFVRGSQRDLFEVVGLVVELHRDGLQRGSVFTRVVGTKE
jgi:hypothetical protein